MDELIERMEYEIARLKDHRVDSVDPMEFVRLSGKIEGVKLALSYVGEKMRKEWEYGMKLDCALNACLSPHADNGLVIAFNERYHGKPIDFKVMPRMNGHAARWVRRSLEYSEWEHCYNYGPE